MNRELDAKIAEIMGITPVRVEKAWTVFTGARGFLDLGDYFYTDQKLTNNIRVPDFSSDPVACYAMEEKIKEMGLMREYGLALARELGLFDNEREMDDWEGKDVFAIAHASPEVRCIAALECLALKEIR